MRVLVLCHGNINRSAFVAAIIRASRPDWDVVSAGLRTRDGRRASRKAREAAEVRGLDLSEHRSRQVNLGAVEQADVVLYMDNGNHTRLMELISTATKAHQDRLRAKCHALHEGTPYTRVPDPNYTSDPAALREQFKIAEECAAHWLGTQG